MAAIKEGGVNNKILIIALSALVGLLSTLAVWTVSRVNALTVEFGVLQQIVLEGKNNRVAYQTADTKWSKEFEVENTAAHRRIEIAMASVISRPEFETKMAEIKLEIQKLKDRMEERQLLFTELQFELKQLQSKQKP